MKKILITLTALIFGLQAFATTTTTTTNWDSTAAQKRLNNIAYKIIKANNLPDGITIKVSDDEEANAYANINKEIYVYKGLLNYATTDDELAAVLGHEMGHIINGHNAKQTILNTAISAIASNFQTESNVTTTTVAKELTTSNLSRKDEFEADLTSVDLLIKSGYSPLAMISVVNKISGNYIDIISTHPSGEKRIMNIYDYTNYNFPEQVKKGYKTDSYTKALALINANINIRNSSPKKIKKYEKEQAKLKKQKLKRAQKMLKSLNGWDASYATLLLMKE